MAQPTPDVSVEESEPRRLSSRQRRIEEQRRKIEALRREQRRKQLSLVGLIVGLLMVVVAGIMLLYRPPVTAQGREMLDEGTAHVDPGTPLTFRSRPPSSGPHYGQTSGYGVFEREVDPGFWVHNLEHGAIVVLYRPDLCDAGCVEQLRGIYRDAPRSRFGNIKMIVTSYRDMDKKIAVVGWRWVDEMDEVDRDRIIAFYREHVDRGPELVP